MRKLSCQTLAALVLLAAGRASVVAAGAVAAVTALLGDVDGSARDAAAGFLVALSTATDGAASIHALALAAAGGGGGGDRGGGECEVIPSVVKMLGDAATGALALQRGVDTLCNCTLTDGGIFAALNAGVPGALLLLLGEGW